MEKYKDLLNKKINVVFGKTVINSYTITDILPTLQVEEGRGKMYKCDIDWANKEIAGTFPVLNFDTRTLDELLEKGQSACPFMSALSYKIR